MADNRQRSGQRRGHNRALSGALLCGGLSSRMGTNKAMVEMRPGIRQLDYGLGLLASVCPRVLACTGPSGRWSLDLPSSVARISDTDEASGPMAGIIAALVAAGGEGVLALACDMPWVDETILECLLAARNDAKHATTFIATDGKPEPMCAIYEASALEPLKQCARHSRGGLRDFMRRVPIEIVPMHNPGRLASVNNLYELKDAHRFFAVRGHL